MTDASSPLDALLAQAEPVVITVLRRRFRASLSLRDDRRDNERALESYQQVMLELCTKFARVVDGSDPPIQSVGDYAARVAHNVANDAIRPRVWTQLANRLRRVISTDPRFASWDHPELGRVLGFAGWRNQAVGSGSLPALRAAMDELRRLPQLGTQWDRLAPGEWGELLDQLFSVAGGPLPMGRVVQVVADLLSVAVEVSLGAEDGDSESALAEVAGHEPSPDAVAIRQAELRGLWACIQHLRREWRLAFLLNLPSVGAPRPAGRPARGAAEPPARASGRSTGRGEIDVLPANGIASIAEIGAVLDLSGADCTALQEALGLELDVAPGAGPIFAVWGHLPLPDAAIGRVLGKTVMQVLGLRKLAIRQLAGCLHERERPAAMPGHKAG